MDWFRSLIQTVGVDAYEIGHPDRSVGRHKDWSRTRKQHLVLHPFCLVCLTFDDLDVHHLQSFHEHPELELDPANLRTLCRHDHWLWGHGRNWKKINTNLDMMIDQFQAYINGCRELPWELFAK